MKKPAKARIIVELDKLVACLPGSENINPGPMVRKLTPRFRHRSGTELRLELEQRQKLITWSTNGDIK